MINTENFTKRLQVIMDYYDLSAASFADKIDVGRSSISHLLSGRNKPSLEFVMKIIRAFPEVELYWLLNGKGSFPGNGHKVVEKREPVKNTGTSEEKVSENKNLQNTTLGKKIKNIVFFYTDGSFEAFEN